MSDKYYKLTLPGEDINNLLTWLKYNKDKDYIVTTNTNQWNITGGKTFKGEVYFDASSTVRIFTTPSNGNDVINKQYVDTGLNNKIDKVNSDHKIYATVVQGQSIVQTTLDYAKYALSNGIVQRDGTQILVPDTPTNNNHAVSKNYVDTELAKKRSTLSGNNLLYATNNTGAQSSVSYTYTTTTGSDAIVQRNNGQIKVLLTPIANDDAASKKYVLDNKTSKALLGTAQTSYLMDDSDAHILGLTMTFFNVDVTGYDLLLLTGLNSSCFILVTQVLTDLLSVMNLPYRNSGITTICKIRATKTGSNFVIDVSSPNADMFNFTNLPTFYLYGIKL